jgi:hypothetical protein
MLESPYVSCGGAHYGQGDILAVGRLRFAYRRVSRDNFTPLGRANMLDALLLGGHQGDGLFEIAQATARNG